MAATNTFEVAVGTPAPQTPLVKHTNDVLAGSSLALYLVAALLFLRFYRKTQDRLFMFFSLAFTILGVNAIIFQVLHTNNEARTYLYGVRALAFSVIIYAIVDKNMARRSSRTPAAPPNS
jgi:cell shape-determining protein MreD